MLDQRITVAFPALILEKINFSTRFGFSLVAKLNPIGERLFSRRHFEFCNILFLPENPVKAPGHDLVFSCKLAL